MILGIDNGYSSSKLVITANRELLYKKIVANQELALTTAKNLLGEYAVQEIGVTGGRKIEFGQRVCEISAISKGGLFLSAQSEGIVVSCGTGTCMTYSDGKNVEHLGGTGIGGGTLLGLGKLLVGTDDINLLEKYAGQGDLSQIDLTVGDIVGTGIGLLPKEITAANFGRGASTKKEDLAAGLFNLVACTIAAVSFQAAKRMGVNSILLVGRVVTLSVIRKKLELLAQTFGLNFTFIENGEFATAIGASLLK